MGDRLLEEGCLIMVTSPAPIALSAEIPPKAAISTRFMGYLAMVQEGRSAIMERYFPFPAPLPRIPPTEAITSSETPGVTLSGRGAAAESGRRPMRRLDCSIQFLRAIQEIIVSGHRLTTGTIFVPT